MYTILILVVTCLGAVLADRDELGRCQRLIHPEIMSCCKKFAHAPLIKNDNENECFQLTGEPPSCDIDICLAKKRGVASLDGTIDKTAFANFIRSSSSNNQALATRLIDTCVEGDFSKYGPLDYCDLMKTRLCLQVNLMADCDSFDDRESCKGIKEDALACVAEYS